MYSHKELESHDVLVSKNEQTAVDLTALLNQAPQSKQPLHSIGLVLELKCWLCLCASPYSESHPAPVHTCSQVQMLPIDSTSPLAFGPPSLHYAFLISAHQKCFCVPRLLVALNSPEGKRYGMISGPTLFPLRLLGQTSIVLTLFCACVWGLRVLARVPSAGDSQRIPRQFLRSRLLCAHIAWRTGRRRRTHLRRCSWGASRHGHGH